MQRLLKCCKINKLSCVILGLSLLLGSISGCQSADKLQTKENSKSTSSSSDASLETASKEDLSSEAYEYWLEEESRGVDLYPDSPLPAYAPYMHDTEHFDNIEEIQKFVDETDPEEYKDGYYYSCIKAIKESGHIIEPYYNGISIFEKSTVRGTRGMNLNFEKRYEGVGYGFNIFYEDGSDAKINMFYIPERHRELFKKQPYRFQSGKHNEIEGNYSSTEEEFLQKTDHIKTTVEVEGKKHTAYYWVSVRDPAFLVQLMFAYEDSYMIVVTMRPESKVDVYEILKNLSFKKIPLE